MSASPRALACRLFATFLALTVVARAEATPLRLMVRVGERDFDSFSVRHERLEIRAADGSPAPAGPRTWRLEGDLRANAGQFCFHPIYAIEPRDPLAWPAPEGRRYDAWIRYGANEAVADFGRGAIVNGLLVVAWIVDGRVSEIAPVPLPADPAAWSQAGALLELTGENRHGAPALLLWTDDGFVTPKPMFGDANANAALADMFFGTAGSRGVALAAVDDLLIRRRTGYGTLLHVAAAGGFGPTIEAMLARNVRVADPCETWGAVGWATRRGRAETVARLTETIPWSRDCGRNIARFAANRGHLDIAAAQFDRFDGWASWTTIAESLAEGATCEGRLDLLQRLAAAGQKSALRRVSSRALICRLLAGDFETFGFLLEHGTDVREPFQRRTVLHVAAESASMDTVTRLLAKKPRLDAKDSFGRTPLMLAARAGRADVCRALIDAGAKSTITDRDGATALDYGTRCGGEATVQLLASIGARPGRGSDAITSPAAPTGDRLYSAHELDQVPTRLSGSDLPKYSVHDTRFAGITKVGQEVVAVRESTAIGSDPEEIVAALIVEADGSVSWVDLLSTETYLSEPADVFLDWRFRPGMRDDRPVRTRLVVRLATPLEP